MSWGVAQQSATSTGTGPEQMLISVHLPKTAGSSFVAALESHFGDELRKDYADVPMNRSTPRRNLAALRRALMLSEVGIPSGIRCIHGHYMPLKYRLMHSPASKVYVTWMRDPVERLASHYFYWRRSFQPGESARLHRRVVEEDWSLERFCFSREMRNTYAKFLWGFPLSNFHFVGITEQFEEEMQRFSSQILKHPLPPLQLNTNPTGGRGPYIDDPDFRQAIERYHAKDMALYHQALEMRIPFFEAQARA